jgi:hypothetical protein
MNAIKINKFIFFIVFKRLFNKGNRKHFFCVPMEFIETLVYGSREGTSDFKLQTSDFKLQTSDFGLQTSDFRH